MDCFRVPREAKLVNSDQKEQGLGTLCRLLIQGVHCGEGPGTSDFFYHCDSAAVSRACSRESSVSSKPLQATCHTEGAEAVMLWRSSARLSTAAFIKKWFRSSGKNGGRLWPFDCILMGSPSLSPHDLLRFLFNADHFFFFKAFIEFVTILFLF